MRFLFLALLLPLTLNAGTCRSFFAGNTAGLQVTSRSDQETMSAIFELVLSPKEAKKEVSNWLNRLESSQKNLKVVDHAALSYLFRHKDIFLGDSEQDRQMFGSRVATLLESSWQKLTGKIPRKLEQPLPKKLLDDLPANVQMFYAISFRSHGNKGQSNFGDLLQTLFTSRKSIRRAIMTAVLGAFAFHITGGEYLSASIGGVVLMSVGEYLFHRFLAHPSGSFLRKLKNNRIAKFLGLYEELDAIGFNHQGIHHGRRSFIEYGEQFDGREMMDNSDRIIRRRMGESFVKKMKRTAYGLVVTTRDHLVLVSPFILLSVAGYFAGVDPVTLALLLGPGYFYPIGLRQINTNEYRYEEGADLRPTHKHLLSYHEYSHLTQEELDRVLQERPWIRKLLFTKLTEVTRQMHWIHHDKPEYNFNLTSFFGDLFYGTLRLPDMNDLARMSQSNDLGYFWGESFLRDSR